MRRLPTGPAYLNTGAQVLIANNNDDDDDDRYRQRQTGLRGRRLIAVLVCLGILCVLAIIALTVS